MIAVAQASRKKIFDSNTASFELGSRQRHFKPKRRSTIDFPDKIDDYLMRLSLSKRSVWVFPVNSSASQAQVGVIDTDTFSFLAG